MSSPFGLLRQQHQTVEELSEELRNLVRQLQELVVFVNAAPKSSDKGIFFIYDDGTNRRLYMRSKRGVTLTTKYKVFDDAA